MQCQNDYDCQQLTPAEVPTGLHLLQPPLQGLWVVEVEVEVGHEVAGDGAILVAQFHAGGGRPSLAALRKESQRQQQGQRHQDRVRTPHSARQVGVGRQVAPVVDLWQSRVSCSVGSLDVVVELPLAIPVVLSCVGRVNYTPSWHIYIIKMVCC